MSRNRYVVDGSAIRSDQDPSVFPDAISKERQAGGTSKGNAFQGSRIDDLRNHARTLRQCGHGGYCVPRQARFRRGKGKIESKDARGSRFFGIVIRMYFNDRTPAHFHAEYGEDEALVEIETLSVLRGELPRRALALVLEWASFHRPELRTDWERARAGTPLESIAPLD